MNFLLLFDRLSLNLVPRQLNFSDFINCLDQLASRRLVYTLKAFETNHYRCNVVERSVLDRA
jgi:hypothetical protein